MQAGKIPREIIVPSSSSQARVYGNRTRSPDQNAQGQCWRGATQRTEPPLQIATSAGKIADNDQAERKQIKLLFNRK